ncbi:UNVERIFIED_CONTAM: hypothetical protein FKN15_047097 [Acipenser sinensis]
MIVPEAGEVKTAMTVPEVGEVKTATTVPEAGEVRTATTVPEVGEVKTATTVPEAGEVRTAMIVPEAGELRTTTTVPDAGEVKTATTVPEAGEGKTATTVPEAGEGKTATTVPEAGEGKTATTVPEAGEVKTATTVPEAGEVKTATTVPEAGEVRTAMIVPEAGELRTTTTVPDAGEVKTATTVPEAGEVKTAMTVPEAEEVKTATTVSEAEEAAFLNEKRIPLLDQCETQTSEDGRVSVSVSLFQDELASTIEHAVKAALHTVLCAITEAVGSKFTEFQVEMAGKEKENESLKLRLEISESELKAVRGCINAIDADIKQPLMFQDPKESHAIPESEAQEGPKIEAVYTQEESFEQECCASLMQVTELACVKDEEVPQQECVPIKEEFIEQECVPIAEELPHENHVCTLEENNKLGSNLCDDSPSECELGFRGNPTKQAALSCLFILQNLLLNEMKENTTPLYHPSAKTLLEANHSARSTEKRHPKKNARSLLEDSEELGDDDYQASKRELDLSNTVEESEEQEGALENTRALEAEDSGNSDAELDSDGLKGERELMDSEVVLTQSMVVKKDALSKRYYRTIKIN